MNREIEFGDEEICPICNCPIKEELTDESCWCGVKIINSIRDTDEGQ